MNLIKKTLYVMGALFVPLGILSALAPGFVGQTLLGQPPQGNGWMQLLGVDTATVGLLAVMVGHRVQDLWWWSWAFALGAAGTGAVTTLHALIGLPECAASWPWWAMAAAGWLFAASLLWGLARAGQENPIV